MELVYLWVEDYKNIHQQGFNFSGRYRCDYNSETNELMIDENKEYIHIFPENINVTAIVGANGAGKSSIIECIKEIFFNTPNIELGYVNTARSYPYGFLLVFSKDEKIEYISNLEVQSYTIPKANVIGHLEWYQYLASDQNKFLYYSLKEEEESYERRKEHYNRFTLNSHKIAEMLTSKYISPLDFHVTTFMYLPNKIDVQVKLRHLYSHMINQYEYSTSFSSFYDMSDEDEDRAHKDARNQSWAKKDDLEQLFENANSDYDRFLIFLYVQNFGDENYHEFDNKKFLLEELDGHWHKLSEREFNKYFQDGIKNIDQFTSKEKDIFFNHYKEFFHIDFIDSENRHFDNLSHGEQTLFGQMLNIYYFSLQEKKDLLLNFRT